MTVLFWIIGVLYVLRGGYKFIEHTAYYAIAGKEPNMLKLWSLIVAWPLASLIFKGE